MSLRLTEEDYIEAAAEAGVPVAAVKAIDAVEAEGDGFLSDGRPKILFEAHWFGKLTHYKWNASYPGLSVYSWDEAKLLYVGGAGEWDRLYAAMTLDRDAARESASWGSGQVMGYNFRDLGFASIDAFVKAMGTARGQLDAMMGYVKFHRLEPYLRRLPDRMAANAFTEAYNGPGQVGVYSPRLISAYNRFANGGPPIVAKPEYRTLSLGARGDDVRKLQEALLGLQLYVGKVDGDFGNRTREAVIAYQKERGLEADGIVGQLTRKALKL